MKFLLWQFGLYALVALGVGAVLSWIWSRSTTSALRRSLDRTARQLGEEREASRKLRRERANERVLLDEATELVGKVTELRAAFAVIDADLHASSLARSEAERSRNAIADQLSDLRRNTSPLDRAEVVRLREELRVANAAVLERETSLRAELSERSVELANAVESLRLLEMRHDESIVAFQQLLSAQSLRAEDAVAEAKLLRARIDVLEALAERSDPATVVGASDTETTPVSEPVSESAVPVVPVIDLRQSLPVLDLTNDQPAAQVDAENDQPRTGDSAIPLLPPLVFPAPPVEFVDGLPVG